jgi:hypothetical protein
MVVEEPNFIVEYREAHEEVVQRYEHHKLKSFHLTGIRERRCLVRELHILEGSPIAEFNVLDILESIFYVKGEKELPCP